MTIWLITTTREITGQYITRLGSYFLNNVNRHQKQEDTRYTVCSQLLILKPSLEKSIRLSEEIDGQFFAFSLKILIGPVIGLHLHNESVYS